MFTLSIEQKISNVREQILVREEKIKRIQIEINHLKVKEQKLQNQKRLSSEDGRTSQFSDENASRRMNLFGQN